MITDRGYLDKYEVYAANLRSPPPGGELKPKPIPRNTRQMIAALPNHWGWKVLRPPISPPHETGWLYSLRSFGRID
jgi:hypothetical protein